jgi:hypothetical protein
LDNRWLAIVIAVLAIALLVIVLITAVFDSYLQSNAAANVEP